MAQVALVSAQQCGFSEIFGFLLKHTPLFYQYEGERRVKTPFYE
jgi:hypothetical protein